ncbi:MAG: ATP-dependent zinc metalloprotease FtsH [Clostridia bacterium]|jgi:cell division protease FtsH|nr:ATP-dependent zinc metalloprotease FtsH [Clostridia bacterium]
MKEIKEPEGKKTALYYYVIILVAILLLNVLVFPRMVKNKIQNVDYGTFLTMLNEKKLDTVEMHDNEIYFVDKSQNVYSTATFNDANLVDRLYKAGVKFDRVVQKTNALTSFLTNWVLPAVIFYFIWKFFMRNMAKKMGGGISPNSMIFGNNRSGAKMYVEDKSGIKFCDVAGEDEAKENLQEVVDFLHNPMKYEEVGAKMPKGVLLVGPPGTGKTLLAKAVAGEASVPFFSIAGSEFVEMFVGMGASKVRDLFKQASEKAPCIVFIDEIDTIGKKRDSKGIAGNDEREQTLNQLLTEMDGFDATKGVIILAATNRPEILDPALLRPGRFDRRVPVELPDLQGRISILKLHAKKVKIDDSCDFSTIAKMASGASGAELANMINEAALGAVRHGRKAVSQSDLEESVEVVIAGYQKKNAILSDEEKHIVAYHEIGHALVAALQDHSAPVQKITIIPRTSGALGYTMQVEQQQKNLMSKVELENKIATLAGGRAAEEIVFNSITTGAANDIEQATKLARSLVTRYGMTDDFDMVALESCQGQYLSCDYDLMCSNETSTVIDRKVIEIVKRQHKKASAILTENREKLDLLSKYLYEKETITGEQFMKLLNDEVVA